MVKESSLTTRGVSSSIWGLDLTDLQKFRESRKRSFVYQKKYQYFIFTVNLLKQLKIKI